MAEKKRKEITQALCRQVQLLIKGGASNREAGEITGTSAATVSRIRTAGYDAMKYQQNTEVRTRKEKVTGNKQNVEEQVPGQMAMDLQQTLPPSDLPPETIEKLQELMKETILTAQVKAIMEKLDDNELKTNRAIYASADRIGAKLDKLNDNLCQILRRLDK